MAVEEEPVEDLMSKLRASLEKTNAEPASRPLEGRRYRGCAQAFGVDGEYNPACCRFPKSCSPYPYQEAIDAGNVTEAMLEPAPEVTDADQLEQAAEIMADQFAPRQLFGSAIEGSTLDDGARGKAMLAWRETHPKATSLAMLAFLDGWDARGRQS